ncbi:hypothetical protein BOO86_13275 [Mycobacterium sp. CBMA 234]|uniref:hypothetical protein n=1 Tax=Mycolicibacterium sp. CBMA 234 TaxID=1918495 RepID=UPI0012DDE941|nr:hypothetical protein [Mycolicibacterium sp. CBMA 234]MUL65443.1 hypothetical protein [Mycolicibacterium sp. CBMA 234]
MRGAVIAVVVAAIGLSGCSKHVEPPADPLPRSLLTTDARSPSAAPLPPADALTSVLYKLADPAVPSAQKIGLIQYGTAEDQAGLDNFTRALRDNGFNPMTVTATDMVWSAGNPGDIIATITMSSGSAPDNKFTFPMEFSPIRDAWQLNRQTATLLLKLGQSGGPSATTTPGR